LSTSALSGVCSWILPKWSNNAVASSIKLVKVVLARDIAAAIG
jgi:hypothetical protein